jgi:TetR/AcrR family tetracycline transcriptional repressor
MSGSATTRRHRRDDVADVALRILDDHGLADLTMRRLAASLDVQPSALYWHFENKQTLIAELADRIVDAHPAPVDAVTDAGADWRERTRIEAAALRDALLAYRDGAEVVSSTYALGLGSGRVLRRLTDAVALAGLDEATTRRAGTALLHFVMCPTSSSACSTTVSACSVPARRPIRGVPTSRRRGSPSASDSSSTDSGHSSSAETDHRGGSPRRIAYHSGVSGRLSSSCGGAQGSVGEDTRRTDDGDG